MNIFNSVRQTRVKKSLFDLTHDVKLSCNMGELIPILNMDCLPGDHVHISGETLVRFAPLIAPMMHRVDVTIHYFFVPWRILWPNWEKFITGWANDPNAAAAVPVLPVVDAIANGTDPNFEKLADLLGIPPITDPVPIELSMKVSALPFAAYERIWFDYYRDQNLMSAAQYDPAQLDDGLNTIGDAVGVIHNRCWEHDYFTAALPWAQKGPSVYVPMAKANTPDSPGQWVVEPYNQVKGFDNQILQGDPQNVLPLSGQPNLTPIASDAQAALIGAGTNPIAIAAGTINDLRKAYKLQEWLEKNARGGTRYKESILAHYGVNTSDKRLQRPEYITGLKTPVVITQVLNTTGTDTLPQGNMAGHGVSITSGKAGSYFCEEHGTIMGILSIMPKTAYQQGISKQFLKYDYLDYGWPEFAHLGEQPIDYNELYAYQVPVAGGEPFGYIPRYAEYKFMQNRVCGEFRSTLNYWHMGRIFSALPVLNSDFVESDPTTRIFAVTDPGTEHMYVQVLNHIKALRPLPKYGSPGW